MPFVLDASVSASWALVDEEQRVASMAAELLKEEVALVPRIWWYEIRNLLVVSERRGRISREESRAFLTILERMPIQIDSSFEDEPVLQLARDHKLSFYDAAYLELALRKEVRLATLDQALKAAALSSGVSLVG